MNDRKTAKMKDNAAGNPYEVIHILSDINRIQILRLLADHGELCARDILSYFPITQPTLSHHMNVLSDNHLVETRKSGRWVFYHLSQAGIQGIIDFFEILKNSQAKLTSPSEKQTRVPVRNRTTLAKPAVPPAMLKPALTKPVPEPEIIIAPESKSTASSKKAKKKDKVKDKDKLTKKDKKKKKNKNR